MYICTFVFLKYIFLYYNYNFELYSVFSRIFISSFLTSSFKIIYQLFGWIQVQLMYIVVILMPLPEARETTRL
jgi:hypothetical protein